MADRPQTHISVVVIAIEGKPSANYVTKVGQVMAFSEATSMLSSGALATRNTSSDSSLTY